MKFTADQHFFHKNMIDHPHTWGWRKFKNEAECRKEIISRFNSVVEPTEEVYHLGDIAMIGNGQADKLRNVIKQLNGIHYLILGNHDELKPQKYIDIGFSRVHTSLKIPLHLESEIMPLGHWWLELHHDPSTYNVIAGMPYGDRTIFLHGHIHTLYKSIKDKRVINVGVDVWDYYPISIKQILKELGLWK